MHYYCSNEGRGGWSSDGIIQDSDPSLPVVCNTTHLTSFSVLVTTGLEEPAEVCNVIKSLYIPEVSGICIFHSLIQLKLCLVSSTLAVVCLLVFYRRLLQHLSY